MCYYTFLCKLENEKHYINYSDYSKYSNHSKQPNMSCIFFIHKRFYIYFFYYKK